MGLENILHVREERAFVRFHSLHSFNYSNKRVNIKVPLYVSHRRVYCTQYSISQLEYSSSPS